MTETSRLRLGVLGCGMIGRAYLEQARLIPGLEVVAVASPSPASRHAASRLWREARLHPDRDGLLADESVEAVLICTPHAHHALDAVAVLTAGKHVLIEKPIATSLNDLDVLEATARRYQSRSVLALPLADTAALAVLRDASQESVIGKPMEFTSALDVPGPPRSNWYYSRAAVGGPSLDTLPYALVRLLELIGTGPAAAVALITQAIQHRRCLDGGLVEQEVEDCATLLLSFSTGQQALVKSSWCVSRAEDYLLIRGRQGDAQLDCWRNTLTVRAPSPPEHPHQVITWDDQPAYLVTLPKPDPERAKLMAFASLISEGGSTLLAGGFAMRLILSALQVRTGKIPIPGPSELMGTTASQRIDLNLGDEYL